MDAASRLDELRVDFLANSTQSTGLQRAYRPQFALTPTCDTANAELKAMRAKTRTSSHRTSLRFRVPSHYLCLGLISPRFSIGALLRVKYTLANDRRCHRPMESIGPSAGPMETPQLTRYLP